MSFSYLRAGLNRDVKWFFSEVKFQNGSNGSGTAVIKFVEKKFFYFSNLPSSINLLSDIILLPEKKAPLIFSQLISVKLDTEN